MLSIQYIFHESLPGGGKSLQRKAIGTTNNVLRESKISWGWTQESLSDEYQSKKAQL